MRGCRATNFPVDAARTRRSTGKGPPARSNRENCSKRIAFFQKTIKSRSPKTPPRPQVKQQQVPQHLFSTHLLDVSHQRSNSTGALGTASKTDHSFYTRQRQLDEREQSLVEWQKRLEREASSNLTLQEALKQREEAITEIERIREAKMAELKNWAQQKAESFNSREQRLSLRSTRLRGYLRRRS